MPSFRQVRVRTDRVNLPVSFSLSANFPVFGDSRQALLYPLSSNAIRSERLVLATAGRARSSREQFGILFQKQTNPWRKHEAGEGRIDIDAQESAHGSGRTDRSFRHFWMAMIAGQHEQGVALMVL